MAKFFGLIGFDEGIVETTPGVWEPKIAEHPYFGDVLRNSRRLQPTDQLNDDINISNEISIVADPYANANFHSIRYVEFMGAKWKVTNVEVQFPRLIMTLGGVWNEQPAETS